MYIRVHIYITMQRITRKLTSNFQGFTNLCGAHAVMKRVAEDINETQRSHEGLIRAQVSTISLCIICEHVCKS